VHTHAAHDKDIHLGTEIADGPELHYHTDQYGNRTSSWPDRPGHKHIHLGVPTSGEIPIFDPNAKVYWQINDKDD
jgi:hypothetical protein